MLKQACATGVTLPPAFPGHLEDVAVYQPRVDSDVPCRVPSHPECFEPVHSFAVRLNHQRVWPATLQRRIAKAPSWLMRSTGVLI